MGAVFDVVALHDLAHQGLALCRLRVPAGLDGGLAGDGVQGRVPQGLRILGHALQQTGGQFLQGALGLAGIQLRGNPADQQVAAAEILHLITVPGQQRPVLQKHPGFLGGEGGGDGGQQGLGHDVRGPGLECFKENPLVGGVLVQEQHGVALLDENIGVQYLPHHPVVRGRGDGQGGLLREFRRLFCLHRGLGVRPPDRLLRRFRCGRWGFVGKGLLPQGRSRLPVGHRRHPGLEGPFHRGRHRPLCRGGQDLGEGLVFRGGHGPEGLPLPGGLGRRGGGLRLLLQLQRRPAGGLVQGRQDAESNAVEHRPLVGELHLGLGRVDVDVHGLPGQLQAQDAAGEAARHHLIGVGLLQGGGHELGFHRPAVDEKLLVVPVAPGGRGLGDVAGQPQILPLAFDLHHIHGQLAAEHLVDGAVEVTVAGGLQDGLPVLDEPEGHVGMGQGLALDGAGHLGGLHGVALHEFQPGRGVVEQIPYHDGGAVGAAGGAALRDPARLQPQAQALGPGGLGQQVDFGHGGDGGQGLSPEAQGADGGQILLGAQLAGGVAQEGGFGVLGGDAAAVVRHPQVGHAAILNFHGHLGGPGVHGVLHQLLDGGGRPLHHLTGGDQIRHMAVQL